MPVKENHRISLLENHSFVPLANPHMLAYFHRIEEEWPVHWHTYFELEIVVEGYGLHVLNGKESLLSPGTAFILTPTDFHRVVPEVPMKLWNIAFDEEMISDQRLRELASGEMQKSFSLPMEQMYKLCSLANLLSSECRRKDGGCCRELCESLLHILLRRNSLSTVHEKTNVTGMQKAIFYLNLHFRENPSLAQTAEQAGFHPHYFSEMFKRTTGENYISYLNKLRTEYAKMLLSQGFTVTETCFQSGFGSTSHFLVTFKRHVGCSPEDYRKQFGH